MTLWSWWMLALRLTAPQAMTLLVRVRLYVDSTAGVLYINTGAINNPTWVVVGTQS
jgi:hypothetical protein